jgi:hypothetical protein
MQRVPVSLAALVFVAGCTSGQSPEAEPDTTAGGATSSSSGVRVSHGQHSSGAKVPNQISRADMGVRWPLTVDEGRLTCIGSGHAGEVVFVAPDGTNYALNGTANSQLTHVANINKIWANDPRLGPGAKKDIGPLINRGLKFCSFAGND